MFQAETFTVLLPRLWHDQGHRPFYRDLIDYEESLPPDYGHRAQYLGNLGWALVQKKQFELAEPLLLASYEERMKAVDTNPSDVKWLLETIVDLYAKMGRANDAARYEQALNPL